MQELNLSKEELARLASLNDEDLAPQPSNDLIFGAQMEALKNEYKSDILVVGKHFILKIRPHRNTDIFDT